MDWKDEKAAALGKITSGQIEPRPIAETKALNEANRERVRTVLNPGEEHTPQHIRRLALSGAICDVGGTPNDPA